MSLLDLLQMKKNKTNEMILKQLIKNNVIKRIKNYSIKTKTLKSRIRLLFFIVNNKNKKKHNNNNNDIVIDERQGSVNSEDCIEMIW